jgi:hypothetical protein
MMTSFAILLRRLADWIDPPAVRARPAVSIQTKAKLVAEMREAARRRSEEAHDG